MKTRIILALVLAFATARASDFDTSWKRDPIRYVNGVRHDLQSAFAWYEASSTLNHERSLALRTGPHASLRLATLDARERLLTAQGKWASRFFVKLAGKRATLTPATVYAHSDHPVDALVRNVPKDAPPFIAAIPIGWVRAGERIVMLYDYGTPEKK